jgi:hypothetical protein
MESEVRGKRISAPLVGDELDTGDDGENDDDEDAACQH